MVDPEKRELRHRADQAKRRSAAYRASSEVESRTLVQELELHQRELEVRNEELQEARGELERGLARYTELFEFAPIGYATLDANGVVRELNLAGASLLQAERSRLIGQPFIASVSWNDHGRFIDLLERARTSTGPVKWKST